MDGYQEEWRKYKRLQKEFFLVWLFYFPVCFPAILIYLVIFGKGSNLIIITMGAVAFVWVGLFLRLGRRLKRWNCPRCHRPFDSWWKGIFTSNCANCGLPKYSN
jgi:hypothetical protein